MLQEVRLLLTALQYFTRVPVPRWVGHSSAQLNGATRYFPAVGVGVGAVAAAGVWVLSMVFPPVLVMILSTAITIALTGAFHEDGLADTFDGLGGGYTRERSLEIMKDSRIGTFGVLALLLVIGAKIAALAAMPTITAMMALIAGHAVSRWCGVLIVWRLPYVRIDDSTRAKPVVERIALNDVLIASVFGLAPLALCGLHAIAGLIAALLVMGYLASWYARRLGGYTGDTLGAVQQLTEAAFYLALLWSWNSL
ncbi:MAG: adenosylcobinamide-GDP ribazoletransferase [Steroidobacteraceae bacterium]